MVISDRSEIQFTGTRRKKNQERTRRARWRNRSWRRYGSREDLSNLTDEEYLALRKRKDFFLGR